MSQSIFHGLALHDISIVHDENDALKSGDIGQGVVVNRDDVGEQEATLQSRGR